MTAVAEIPSGTVIANRYLIKKVLGQGGFGRTYLALDQKFNEDCVLKEFVPHCTKPELVQKARDLFDREAKTLYQLKHPQIPKLIDSLENQGRLFLVQEYVDGKTYQQLIEERVQGGQTFSEDEVIEWLLQLLPVLGYIHKRQIVHRDISPDNIMLPNGCDEVPVLIDFGAVKQVIAQSQGNTPPGTRIGKADYSAPEQRMGECYLCSDIYSLGVTALVLLSGKAPSFLFDNQSLSWQWQNHARVSSRLAGILDKMLAEKSLDRYQRAEEVIIALQSNSTKQSSPTRPLHRTPPPVRASVPWKPIALSTLTVAIVSGVLIGVSPHTPVCQSLNICATETIDEFTEQYNEAVKQFTNARTMAVTAKSIQDLQDARLRMQNAITALNKILPEAKIYTQVQQVLPGYRSELTGMEKRLVEETKAQNFWDEAIAIATEASNNINLEDAKVLWQNAIAKLEAVQPTSLLAQEAVGRSQVYQLKVAEIDKQLSAIAAEKQRERQAAPPIKRQPSPPEPPWESPDDRGSSKPHLW